MFIGDVENAGTLGDALGGFTELERAEEGLNDLTDIINRVKFGTEVLCLLVCLVEQVP